MKKKVKVCQGATQGDKMRVHNRGEESDMSHDEFKHISFGGKGIQ